MHNQRYKKEENEILRQKYPSATKEEILALIPGRSWTAIAAHAYLKLGLLRTREAKGRQITMGKRRIVK